MRGRLCCGGVSSFLSVLTPLYLCVWASQQKKTSENLAKLAFLTVSQSRKPSFAGGVIKFGDLLVCGNVQIGVNYTIMVTAKINKNLVVDR